MSQKKRTGRVTTMFPDGVDVFVRESTQEESARFLKRVHDVRIEEHRELRLRMTPIIFWYILIWVSCFLFGLGVGQIIS